MEDIRLAVVVLEAPVRVVVGRVRGVLHGSGSRYVPSKVSRSWSDVSVFGHSYFSFPWTGWLGGFRGLVVGGGVFCYFYECLKRVIHLFIFIYFYKFNLSSPTLHI